MDADRLLAQFEQSLGGRNPKTIAAYLTIVRDFARWITDYLEAGPFHMGLFTEANLQAYINHLKERGKAVRTQTKALTALSRFCRWAVEEGRLRRNPVQRLERPQVIEMAPSELSPLQRLMIKNLVERWESARLSAIFALGYWTGLRISEVACLKLKDCDVNQRTGVIIIHDGKGGKTRTLDLHTQSRRALYEYLNEDRCTSSGRDPASAYVFTSQRSASLRRQTRPDNLSSRGIEHLWTRVKARATRTEWEHIQAVTFHDLRHDWAHRARASGWPLEDIAVYLGHQTREGVPAIRTTVRYTLPSRQQLKERLQDLKG
jgi:site-specific recombinase XerD